MTDLRIARRSAVVDLDGTPYRVRRGRTLAVADHPVVTSYPYLWRPLAIDFPAALTADTDDATPVARNVRAWAKEQGLDVPARGPLPDEIIAAYQTAHTEDT